MQLLQTDKADTHTEIKSAAITQLPLQQNRNYQSLINLVPGATPGVMQNSEVDTPGRALTTNVNGLNRNNNGTKTDGATNVNIWLPHHTMLVSPAETIDTVNVSTSNFDAEQGMAGGAAITVITKSGTNEFKGSAFEFYNNESLNATPYFATEKSLHAHITGATLGGPIMKNKLFFFGVVGRAVPEDAASRSSSTCRPPRCAPATSARRSTPTARCRSSTTRPPAMLTAREGRRSPATSIPANRIDADRRRRSRRSTRRQPAGRAAGANVGGAASRATTCRSEPQVRPQQLRLQGELQPVAAGADLGQVLADGRRRRFAAGATWVTTGVLTGDTTVNQYTFGTTWTLNPTTVFDATFGISKMTHESTAGDFGLGNFGLEDAGHPRHERRRELQQRPAIRRHAVVPHRASATDSATTMGGRRCSATSGPTRSRPT